jgi:hypothetical protein
MNRRTAWAVGAVAISVLPLIACGSDRAGLPTTPSNALSATATTTRDLGTPSGSGISAQEATATPVTVTSLVSGTACPTLQFKISAYLFKTSADTRYDGGSCSSIKAGTKITFTATRANDNEQVFYVSQITMRLDTTPAPTPPPTPVSADVTVTALVGSTSCPTLTFMVGAYTIATNASTRFYSGTCANVKAGSKLGLTGSKLGEASVLATVIVFKDQEATPRPPTAPTRPPQPVEGEGVITSLTSGTACPALKFMIGSYAIALDAATQYLGGVCGDLKAGMTVGVKGNINADGNVTASLISVKSETPRPEPEAEGEGFVSGLVAGTACPALQFQIGEYTITVSASTQFAGGGCSGIALGKKVGVKGRMTGAKTAAASLITIKN